MNLPLRLVLLTLGLILVALDAKTTAQVTSYPATAAQITDYLSSHNAARAGVNPPAYTAMPDLTWDTMLATVATNYAMKCIWGHNADRTTDYALQGGSGYVGENLYAISTSSYSPTSAVNSWVSEKVDYTYTTNTCTSGKQCGHYTQVVWAKTLHVGCGAAYCPSLQGLTWGGTIVVCNYAPGGNYVGQWPYSTVAPPVAVAPSPTAPPQAPAQKPPVAAPVAVAPVPSASVVPEATSNTPVSAVPQEAPVAGPTTVVVTLSSNGTTFTTDQQNTISTTIAQVASTYFNTPLSTIAVTVETNGATTYQVKITLSDPAVGSHASNIMSDSSQQQVFMSSVDEALVSAGLPQATAAGVGVQSPSPSGSNLPIGAIVGGAIGGVALIALIVAGVLLYRRRRANSGWTANQPKATQSASPYIVPGEAPSGPAYMHTPSVVPDVASAPVQPVAAPCPPAPVTAPARPVAAVAPVAAAPAPPAPKKAAPAPPAPKKTAAVPPAAKKAAAPPKKVPAPGPVAPKKVAPAPAPPKKTSPGVPKQMAPAPKKAPAPPPTPKRPL